MGRKRILLVDADAELLRLLAVRCREIGLDVDTARDATSAVTWLDKRKPDLVCLDDELPGGGGLRLSEIVLKSPDDVACPVILLTTRSQKGAAPSSPRMCVYRVQKRPDLWRFLEPVVHELVDVRATRRSTGGGGKGRTEHVS